MKKKKVVILAITLLILGLIFYKIDLEKLVETFKNFNCKYLLQIVILYVATLIIRGFRWKYLLNNDSRYSPLNLAKVFTVGSMLNSFVPARAGDLYRAYYLGSKIGENKIKIFGSVILERIFDGISVFAILLYTVLATFSSGIIMQVTYITGILFLGSLGLFYFFMKYSDKIEEFWEKRKQICPDKMVKIFDKVMGIMSSFIEGFRVLDNSYNAVCALVLSFAIWLIEAFISYLFVMSFGFTIDGYSGLYIMSLTSFSTVIPSASVFLGPYQIAYIMALGIFGIGKSQALAVSAVHQAVFMIILAVIGIFYFIKFNISFNDIKGN